MIGGAMSNEDKTKYMVILMYSIIINLKYLYISTKYYDNQLDAGNGKKCKDANFHENWWK